MTQCMNDAVYECRRVYLLQHFDRGAILLSMVYGLLLGVIAGKINLYIESLSKEK
jgi:hypothetical protein